MKSSLILILLNFCRADDDDEDNWRLNEVEWCDDLEELRDYTRKNKYVLTYFFHQNCHPCRDFQSRFEHMPFDMMGVEWSRKVAFAGIDVTGHQEKANAMFGVKGFPWIALFKDGVPSRYKGQRIHRKIINYMYRRIHTPFREIKDINGAISIKDNYNEDSSVLCISYFPEGSKRFEILRKLVDHYDHITFIRTSDAEVAKELGLEFHGVGLRKRSIPDRLNMFNGTISEEAMIYYLDNYGNPLIAEYSDETAMMLHEDHYKWHSYLFLPGKDKVKNKEETEKKMNEFMNYALVTEDAGHGKDSVFLVVDADNESHQKVLGFFDIDPDETPAFVIHNTENDNVHGFRNMQESDWNWKKLDNILEGARRENKFIISEGDNHEHVTKSDVIKLTHNNIEQMVKDLQPLLVYFYEQTPGHYDPGQKTIDVLIKRFNKKSHSAESPRIGKFDLSKNVVPKSLFGFDKNVRNTFVMFQYDDFESFAADHSHEAVNHWLDTLLGFHDEL